MVKRKRSTDSEPSLASSLETSESSQAPLKRQKPQKPRKSRHQKSRSLKISVAMFSKCENAMELVGALQRTNVTSAEVKALCVSVQKTQEATMPGPTTGQEPTTTSRQERHTERQNRMKMLWQQVVFRLYYKVQRVRENQNLSEEQKGVVMRRMHLKGKQLTQILDMLQEMVVLEQVRDELYGEASHVDVMESTMGAFQGMIPTLYRQIMSRMRLPFQMAAMDGSSMASPFSGAVGATDASGETRTTPKRGRKKTKTPFKNITNEPPIEADVPLFESDRWRQQAERRVLTIPSARRVATKVQKEPKVEATTASTTGASKVLPLKRSATSDFGGIGTRRKRRRRDAATVSNLTQQSASMGANLNFEIPETTYG